MVDENADEHREILAKKGNALKSPRGLQIWGSQDDMPETPGADLGGGHGNASMGTAERQSKTGYMAEDKDKKLSEMEEE